jgi:hypothetical protein
VVVALGVEEKKQLDEAILSHGRILHDANVISINTQNASRIGSINWSDQEASSLCEMVTDIVQSLSGDILDKQNSTALLTGIVAETDRYSNEKATPHTMSIAGALMSAGASTQLVSNELDSALKSQDLPEIPVGEGTLDEGASNNNSGVLDIDHTEAEQEETPDNQEAEDNKQEEPPPSKPADEYLENLNLSEDPHKSDSGSENDSPPEPDQENPPTEEKIIGRLVKDPPHFTGQLTANTVPEEKQYTGSTDPLSNIPDSTLLGADKSNEEIRKEAAATASSLQQKVDQTLREIEESVSSPHLGQEEQHGSVDADKPSEMPAGETARPSVEEARRAAEAAAGDDERPESRRDMGTTQLGDDISHNDESGSTNLPPPSPPPITPLS